MKRICFDIGGTYIKYGILDQDGAFTYKSKVNTPRENCKDAIPELLCEIIDKYKREFYIGAVGISTAGQVDSSKGEIIFACDNLPGYTGAKLKESIEKHTNINTFVENDVNAAALGELWKGTGKEYENFVCITLGTGIGGAIVINRKLYKGLKGNAGEVGHTTINEFGEECTCGGRGCYERYASTLALTRNYTIKSRNKETIDGEILLSRVRNDEVLAISVYNEFIQHVVSGIINIAYILDPGIIIIGGGISAAGEKFFKDINEKFQQRIMPLYRYTRIVQASLGNDAGLMGACYITLQ